jgi:alpha-beta hydrolase superfamily lysophospholipase
MQSGVMSAHSYANPFEIDQRAQLAALDIPTLVMHGRHDTFVPHEIASRAADLLPRGALITVEHNGHAPFLQEGAAYVSALLEFPAVGVKRRQHSGLKRFVDESRDIGHIVQLTASQFHARCRRCLPHA